MKYKNVAFIVLILIFGFYAVIPGAAYSSPKIRVNGELRNFNPAPQIVNDRTMVPVRFVIEDEALGGKVYWDSELRKVTLDCRGKHIEFSIGSTEAAVDGQAYYLDNAPYIYNNRTFVPLRFIAETLGAVVAWDSGKWEVSIDFGWQPRIFAYYYCTPVEELEENAHLFSDVVFRWFETNAQGELYYEYRDDYDEVLGFARKRNIKTHAGVALMDREALHSLLSSKENRARLIGSLLDQVKQNHYDGVNIDFEFIAPEDGGFFTVFLQELKASLGPDKVLSVAVFARTGKENWSAAYEYSKIGKIADLVVVMAYDYSYKTTAPGAIAPLWWVEDVVAYAVENIPREKVLLGIPTYGYNWSSSGACSTVTASKLAEIKARYTVEENFDLTSMSPSYAYVDEYQNVHQIWFENERSLKEKWEVASENGLGGISFWRIGNGCNDLYKILADNP